MTARLADAITALANRPTGVTMLRGTSTSTTNVVDVGNATTVKVTAWVNRPASAGKTVVILMQSGSVLGLGLD